MIQDEELLKKERSARIRRVRAILKYLPRRATLHRYPFIKYFEETARKRAYLWSFRLSEAIPAIYAGSILSFMPFYGVQIPLAFLTALVFRANLMILVGLQLITNPFTIVPIYGLAYWLGDMVMNMLTPGAEPLLIATSTLDQETVGQLGEKGRLAFHLFAATCIGGAMIGYIFAFIASMFYRGAAKRAQNMHDFHLLGFSHRRKHLHKKSKKK